MKLITPFVMVYKTTAHVHAYLHVNSSGHSSAVTVATQKNLFFLTNRVSVDIPYGLKQLARLHNTHIIIDDLHFNLEIKTDRFLLQWILVTWSASRMRAVENATHTFHPRHCYKIQCNDSLADQKATFVSGLGISFLTRQLCDWHCRSWSAPSEGHACSNFGAKWPHFSTVHFQDMHILQFGWPVALPVVVKIFDRFV